MLQLYRKERKYKRLENKIQCLLNKRTALRFSIQCNQNTFNKPNLLAYKNRSLTKYKLIDYFPLANGNQMSPIT